jgi:hypothetical protein
VQAARLRVDAVCSEKEQSSHNERWKWRLRLRESEMPVCRLSLAGQMHLIGLGRF